MSALPKIPSPPSHYWREFRHTYLPFIVFSSVLLLTVNLWNQHVAPPSIVGQVESVRSSVTTTVQGELMELRVDMLQEVKKGDIIAMVNVMDDDVVNASLKAAEANLVTMEERLRQNNYRILENFENLKHDLAVRKVERATENVNLQFAVAEFNRTYKLYQEKTVSETEYDMARTRMDALKGKLTELDKLIGEMEISIARLRPPADLLSNTNASDPIFRAIQAEREQIIAQAKPQVIKAPMAGVISAIYKRKGEKVIRGDTIVVISTLEPERIMAFVRQPLNIRPKVGDTVEVRSRSFARPAAYAKVMKVGTQLEAINVPLPLAVQNQGVEFGLPLLIALPKGIPLMPGETVDISMVNHMVAAGN
jgi:multidrug resistance efflux pump